MGYNPILHNRKSIRLKGYDYAQAGLYFVTICVQKRACMFGYIKNGKLHLNDAGKMIEKWYYELENKFPDIKCHEKIVMPNHFHCIIENVGPVGADQRVCPIPISNEKIPISNEKIPISNEKIPILGEHAGSPLHRVIQWFKTMSTNEYIRNVKTNNWPRFEGKLWQRNYYEHIILNPNAYEKITKYIIENPFKWDEDRFNSK